MISESEVARLCLRRLRLNLQQAIRIELLLVELLGVHANPATILEDTLVPYVNLNRLHGWAARNLHRLVLIHCGTRALSRPMIAEARAILDVETEELTEVLKVGTNNARASVAVALSTQTELADCSSRCTLRVHDLFVTNVVSDEV